MARHKTIRINLHTLFCPTVLNTLFKNIEIKLSRKNIYPIDRCITHEICAGLVVEFVVSTHSSKIQKLQHYITASVFYLLLGTPLVTD